MKKPRFQEGEPAAVVIRFSGLEARTPPRSPSLPDKCSPVLCTHLQRQGAHHPSPEPLVCLNFVHISPLHSIHPLVPCQPWRNFRRQASPLSPACCGTTTEVGQSLHQRTLEKDGDGGYPEGESQPEAPGTASGRKANENKLMASGGGCGVTP